MSEANNPHGAESFVESYSETMILYSDPNILLGPSTSGARQNSAISIAVNGIGHLKCQIDGEYEKHQYNSQYDWEITTY